MGLFDKLINSLKTDVDGVFGKVVDDVDGAVSKVVDKVYDELVTTKQNSTTCTSNTESQDDSRYANNHNTGDEYFAALIKESEFPLYTIERNVHPSVFDSSAHPKCFPISYLFRLNGEPKLAVFIMQTNQYKSMIAKGSYDILDDNNIHYIRFFKGMENEKSYVLNRIRENLNV